jgi:hypothetical protein
MKTLFELKATLLDDDAFRLLALPFGGPIPYPGAPRGADLDRQWLSERTDFGAPPKRVPVTWHHGLDRVMGKATIAEAGDLEFDDEGGWVTVWMKHGERRVNLVKRLADEGAQIFGSSEAAKGSGRLRKGQVDVPWNRALPGEITRWHYAGQTLSTSPQNTNSILLPVKATLTDLASDELAATPDYFDDLARFLDNLRSDPAPTPASAGDGEAKAGRVLASRNEARLREARDLLDESYFDAKRRKQAIEAITSVLAELETLVTN